MTHRCYCLFSGQICLTEILGTDRHYYWWPGQVWEKGFCRNKGASEEGGRCLMVWHPLPPVADVSCTCMFWNPILVCLYELDQPISGAFLQVAYALLIVWYHTSSHITDYTDVVFPSIRPLQIIRADWIQFCKRKIHVFPFNVSLVQWLKLVLSGNWRIKLSRGPKELIVIQMACISLSIFS